MLLEGIFAPLTTCFYGDGRPYWRKLEQNVEHYSRTPVSGFVLLDATGEAVMLSDEESREALRVARDAARPEKILLAGVGRESVWETLRLIEYAALLDYDAVLVGAPRFYRPRMGRRELLTYYRTVADRSPLPVVLDNLPAYTSYDLPAEVIAELAMHPNIVGLKESSGEPCGGIERIRQIVEKTRAAGKRLVSVTSVFATVTARMQGTASRMQGTAHGAAGQGQSATATLLPAAQLSSMGTPVAAAPSPVATATPPTLPIKPRTTTRIREVGFQVLSGSAQILHAGLKAGATGGVLPVSTFAPQACHEIYTAWKEGDEALAAEKQQRVIRAELEVTNLLGVSGVKYALDLNGYFGGVPRMPLLPLTGEEKKAVEETLRDLRN